MKSHNPLQVARNGGVDGQPENLTPIDRHAANFFGGCIKLIRTFEKASRRWRPHLRASATASRGGIARGRDDGRSVARRRTSDNRGSRLRPWPLRLGARFALGGVHKEHGHESWSYSLERRQSFAAFHSIIHSQDGLCAHAPTHDHRDNSSLTEHSFSTASAKAGRWFANWSGAGCPRSATR
jgi:hypothetical protein